MAWVPSGPVNIMGDGRYERQLVNALTECGIPAMRAPASGSATERFLPDILAGRQYILDGITGPYKTLSDCWAIELKTGGSTTLYLKETEARTLGAFSQAFGATPCAGAKFKSRGGQRTPIWVVPLSECRRTDSGNLGVPASDVDERALFKIYPSTANADAEVEWFD